MNEDSLPRIDRRLAIKWILAAGAGAALGGGAAWGRSPAVAPLAPRDGYGTDPDLVRSHAPGDFWPLTFTLSQRRDVTAFCDVILPADGRTPGASSLGVPDFIDEWVSAPYPEHASDRSLILEGLAWVDAESNRRFKATFADAGQDQRAELCDAMAPLAPKGSAMEAPSAFFRRLRNLVAAGFYSTPQGMRDLGYVGNVPLARFEGPPADLVARLGLTDEVQW